MKNAKKNCSFIKVSLLVLLFYIAIPAFSQKNTISPGQLWIDDQGNHIQAHGGGIINYRDTYFWYGEERRQGLDSAYRYVSCYSSKDLSNWKFEGDVFKMSDPDNLGRKWVLERPKVYYNRKTGKFVMYMHIDGQVKGEVGNYKYARVGTAISDLPTGPFKFIRTFRPLGRESRDIGQFVDDDGSAYLIFEDRPAGGFHIAKLSGDYLDVKEDVCFIKAPLEGGAIVNYNGLYYAIGSALTGWAPNPNKFATAKSLRGPWSSFKDIAPSETNTYNSQSTFMLKITGSKSTSVIFVADQWKPGSLWDSRYLWMPLNIGNGALELPKPRPWKINVETGKTQIIK